jgi:hypothetical protein
LYFIHDKKNDFFTGPGAVSKREAKANAINDWYEEKKNSILGGTCLTDDQCSVISHCDLDGKKTIQIT